MNKQRRRAILSVIDQLGNISQEVNDIQCEEQEYYDNMPESLQSSEAGERAEEVSGILEEITDSIGELVEQLKECI
jgi:methyl-accepting chemotaxis protein